MSSFIEERFNADKIIFNMVGGPTWKTSITQTNNGRETRNAVWSYPLSIFEFADRTILEDEMNYVYNFFNSVQGMDCGFRLKDWTDYQDNGQGVVNTDGLGSARVTGQLFKIYGTSGRLIQKKICKPVAGTIKVFIDGILSTGSSVNPTTGSVSLASTNQTATATSSPSSSTTNLTFQGHSFLNGNSVKFIFSGGTWASANGNYTVSVIDANTISIALNSTGLGLFSSAQAITYPQLTNSITWTGEYDVPVRFDSDSLAMSMIGAENPSYGVLGAKAFDLKAMKLVELKL